MGLILENVYKTFGSNIAVNNLSMEMDAPGVFGLIGTNGAGKTTAIRVILGIMLQDSGEVSWNGGKITRESVKFGYLPEERGIYMKNKVLEQLVYFGELRGMSRGAAKASALEYLEKLGIPEYANVPAEKLSKGNQQKIQLIAALIHDPEIIFLDEPFSGLDPLNTETLASLIRELAARKKYIIMSSHQMSTVEEFCENIAILHKGHTLLKGNLAGIKAGYGRKNLVVAADGDISGPAAEFGLGLISASPGESEYRVSGREQAEGFLHAMLEKGIFPVKYLLREPTLHEIFIDLVSKAQNSGGAA